MWWILALGICNGLAVAGVMTYPPPGSSGYLSLVCCAVLMFIAGRESRE